MEIDCDAIITEYQRADLTKRLHLFMSYRDLRLDFMEIECDQMPGILQKGATGASKPAIIFKVFLYRNR